jgi:hypothetical protein
MRGKEMCVKFLLVNLMDSSYVEELRVDEGHKKYDGMAELDLSCSEEGQVVEYLAQVICSIRTLLHVVG